ncbi:MAG: protein-L-isoaspartate(D-aspartate) O-methyltransferase [Candidatus Thiodiazotropha sp. (ex Ctena orbiculata)]|nr:protein-L-isoaspartate(D-aspartate) O-methyltransferase [Candidatus Thiodiazotropha taylori]MBT2998473.1 protein-L-isoaspartate(D-aspartate) O-methyltransferase [Candidatus Thiodiazotropha taylori]MBT3002150.1 protein-L-isoaspartate(D-aspartate) O-methyltransferase [Candidatus Thiodiazotropha taylori]MBT3026429.1 protein-L-isoaspartate(D-aspartate) O-methyltransferase [Candidatus Thiodiazotropha taylori]MBT3034449.1 protein-L-isoaspartate(D-aspartate) O-methyltransferase [Candidatus Thiodiaz
MSDIQGMLSDIQAEAEYACRMTGLTHLNDHVLAAMERVPRHHFVSKSFRSHAFDNSPLPIGKGQTISQPFIVALMTDLIAPKRSDKILEVGTGSGYQTAVLAELVGHLYTIEIIPKLAQKSRRCLEKEGYSNISFLEGDGYYGWPDQAPFDAIMVTAAVEKIPEPLVDQLAPGGRLVLPVGERRYSQDLILVTKDHAGVVHKTRLMPVSFVPMTGTR